MKDLYIKTKDGDMFYKKYGDGPCVILLHGWGQNSETFESVINDLKNSYKVYVVDFLGFGLSDESEYGIKVKDYSEHLKELVDEEDIVNPIIIGHSFGGRVAIDYASKNNVEKLVLVNSAGIRHRGIKYYFKVIKYKVKKIFVYLFNYDNYYSFIRKNSSRDYRNLSDNMRKTFKNVIKKDLKREMKKIDCDTLIISSVLDKEVPVKDGEIMKKLIRNSELVLFYRSGHFSYIDEESKFIRVVRGFIGN